MITIERIDNGWLIGEEMGTRKAVLDEKELLEEVLILCCGRCENFGGDSYGKVTLSLKDPEGLK